MARLPRIVQVEQSKTVYDPDLDHSFETTETVEVTLVEQVDRRSKERDFGDLRGTHHTEKYLTEDGREVIWSRNEADAFAGKYRFADQT